MTPLNMLMEYKVFVSPCNCVKACKNLLKYKYSVCVLRHSGFQLALDTQLEQKCP